MKAEVLWPARIAPIFAFVRREMLTHCELMGLPNREAGVYDPNLGQFLQTDPVGSKDDLDLYAYVGGYPINGSDPTGTEMICGPCLLEKTGQALKAAGDWLNVKIATDVPVSLTLTPGVGFATMASGQAQGTTDYIRLVDPDNLIIVGPPHNLGTDAVRQARARYSEVLVRILSLITGDKRRRKHAAPSTVPD